MIRPIVIVSGIFLLWLPVAAGVPLPVKKQDDKITDPSQFIPHRRHLPLPGKIVALLVVDAQSVLASEGRSGPADSVCIAWNGGSYRWVYLPTDGPAVIQNLSVKLPDEKTKVFPKLDVATQAGLKPRGFNTLYALAEVEVNDGLGSSADDSFVATSLKRLDGTEEYPLDTSAIIEKLKAKYEGHLTETQKDLDAAMLDIAAKAISGRDPTGPREKTTILFATWLPDAEKMQIRFLTRITDGEYKYVNGIKIELASTPQLKNGLRYGKQFGIEYGVQYEVSKDGKLDRVKTLELQSFQKELPPLPVRFPNKRP